MAAIEIRQSCFFFAEPRMPASYAADSFSSAAALKYAQSGW
jgi:hypothetical protein